MQVDEGGVAGLVLKSGRTETADLYIDCSGFASLLLSRTLHEPYQSFKASLFCDRAIWGGWERTDEPIRPYTTAEAMNAGVALVTEDRKSLGLFSHMTVGQNITMCTLAEARPPIDSGGPSATMRPAAMTTTRSARA